MFLEIEKDEKYHFLILRFSEKILFHTVFKYDNVRFKSFET